MKFNCGKSWETKRKELEERAAYLNGQYEAGGGWLRSFAWLPRRIADGDCRWLEHYEHRNSLWVSAYPFSDDKLFPIGKWEFRAVVKEKK